MRWNIVIAAVILSGCTDATKEGDSEPAKSTLIGHHNSIKVYVTDKGLECAVYDGIREAGISCNWQKYNDITD